MNRKQLMEANRIAWNEVNEKHQRSKQQRGKFEKFKQIGFSKLDQTITDLLGAIGIKGKNVAQVCCNDGEESTSLKNMGALSVTGFDISDEAIQSAKELSEISGVPCEFVRTDIYEIPEKYFDKFDLVYISVGSLMWFPDMNAFFCIITKLLNEGGSVVIYDMHPFSLMLDNEDKQNPYQIKYDYFFEEPRVFTNGLDYVGNETYEANPVYNFDPTLSEIFNGMIQNGLKIERFDEYDHDMSALFDHLAHRQRKLPLSMSIVGKRM